MARDPFDLVEADGSHTHYVPDTASPVAAPERLRLVRSRGKQTRAGVFGQ